MRKKMAVIGIAGILAAGMLAGCSGGADDNGQESQSAQEVSGDSAAQSSSGASEDDGASGETQSITVSAAASLTGRAQRAGGEIQRAGSGHGDFLYLRRSGALQTQIEEGAPVDLFFSAAEENMDALEEEGLIDTQPGGYSEK